ncbi:hypothetical protein ACEUCH_08365 [Aeromonas hydrophila]|uniref:hypothetical protein n=1 Tax=Aeromonas hydrophila TaxID=644 RepID=UPI0038D0BDC5
MSRRKKDRTKNKQPTTHKGKHEAVPTIGGAIWIFLKGMLFQLGQKSLSILWKCFTDG